jgi:hypothetical protein
MAASGHVPCHLTKSYPMVYFSNRPRLYTNNGTSKVLHIAHYLFSDISPFVDKVIHSLYTSVIRPHGRYILSPFRLRVGHSNGTSRFPYSYILHVTLRSHDLCGHLHSVPSRLHKYSLLCHNRTDYDEVPRVLGRILRQMVREVSGQAFPVFTQYFRHTPGPVVLVHLHPEARVHAR